MNMNYEAKVIWIRLYKNNITAMIPESYIAVIWNISYMNKVIWIKLYKKLYE